MDVLHAFIHKNVRRVLAPKQDEHKNEKAEDAVTSMIFTPLAFMTAAEALRAMRALLGKAGALSIPAQVPTSFDFDLWPKGMSARGWTGADSTRCEPDLVITFRFLERVPFTFIGEMKWDWRMPEDDLARELTREREAVGASGLHHPLIFVVTKYRKSHAVAGAPVLTWENVSANLVALSRSPLEGGAMVWASLVRAFLDKVDLNAFSGFPTADHTFATVPPSTPFWSASK